ncbi:hypothetical protein V8E54_008580 [Elaphomyces granulatus]
MTLNQHFTWFGEQFDRREIFFPSYRDHAPSSWMLGENLGERYTQLDEALAKEDNAPSEAWAAYLCHNVDGEKAVVKIRMQIPYRRSESNPSASRARQALQEPSPYVHREIKALARLAEGACTSSPVLLGHTQEEQDATMWIPGGYIVYILMTWCPGVVLLDFWRRDPAERQVIRNAFKIAYEDCLRCSVVHGYPGWDNLIWDSETGKCYIIGFRFSRGPRHHDTWRETIFRAWNLVRDSGQGLVF